MGFKQIKRQVIECLTEGLVSHELRNRIEVKNLLATGQVTLDDVVSIIKKAKGTDYSTSLHHLDSSIEVHVVKVRLSNKNWYIKWYFVEPNAIFISVHH